MRHDDINQLTATVASGTDVSDTLEIKGQGLVGILTPAVLTNAACTFEASVDGDTWVQVDDDSATQKSVMLTVDRWIILPITSYPGFLFLRLKFAGNEAAERVFQIFTRNLNG